MSVGPETVATTLVVDPEGRPLRASALRWRSEGEFRFFRATLERVVFR